MDKIKVYRKCGKKYDYHYRHSCKECKKDRGYLPHKVVPDLCRSCAGKISHLNPSEETRAKMSESKKGKPAWNKGLTDIYSEESKKNMGTRNIGREPYNKGVEMPIEQKVKLSCINRDIEVEEFDDFTTPENKRQRNIFSESNLHKQCFELANYTCDITGRRGCELHAHHLESWHSNEELRFDINNLVCLSKEAHDIFHSKYGRKNNTKEQYEEFKKLGLA